MAQIETEELLVARHDCLERIVNALGDLAVNARKLGMTNLRVEIGKEGFVNLFPHYKGEQPDEPVPVHTLEEDTASASRAIHHGLKSFYSSSKPLTPTEEGQLCVLMKSFMNLLEALSSSPKRLSPDFTTFLIDTFFAQEGSSEEGCGCSCRDDVDNVDEEDEEERRPSFFDC